jgi:DNA-binding transcriptional ArsR family regulator
LLASTTLGVDACRHVVRRGGSVVSLARRPALFALARALGEAWPGDAPRDALVARAFGAKRVDESHRARLRVEVWEHARVLAFLADGESRSTSALALVLATSQRTVQRALDSLQAAGKVQSFGRGRARRGVAAPFWDSRPPCYSPRRCQPIRIDA